MGNYNNIIAPRNYRTREVLKASYLDDILNVYDTGFDDLYGDLRQVLADVFGPSNEYQLLQRGYATQANPIIDIATGISARDWIFTGDITIPSSITVDQLGGDYTLAFANPASDRTITFPDPLGDDSVAYLNAMQTLSDKTFINATFGSPLSVNSVAATDSIINLNVNNVIKWSVIDENSTDQLRIKNAGGSVIAQLAQDGSSCQLNGIGVASVLALNSAVNTNSTLRFSENGTTKWSQYNNNSGDNLVLSNASGVNQVEVHQTAGLLLLDKDPPSSTYNGTKHGFIGARLGYVDNSGVVTDSYNIDYVISDDGNGTYSVGFDTNFTSDLAAVVVTPNSASLDLCTTVAMTGGGTSCFVEIYDVSSGTGVDADFSLIAAGKFS